MQRNRAQMQVQPQPRVRLLLPSSASPLPSRPSRPSPRPIVSSAPVRAPPTTFPFERLIPELQGEVVARLPALAASLLALSSSRLHNRFGPSHELPLKRMLVLAAAEGDQHMFLSLRAWAAPFFAWQHEDLRALADAAFHRATLSFFRFLPSQLEAHQAYNLAGIVRALAMRPGLERSLELMGAAAALEKGEVRPAEQKAQYLRGLLAGGHLGEFEQKLAQWKADLKGSNLLLECIAFVATKFGHERVLKLLDVFGNFYGHANQQSPVYYIRDTLERSNQTTVASLKALAERLPNALEFFSLSEATTKGDSELLSYLLSAGVLYGEEGIGWLEFTEQHRQVLHALVRSPYWRREMVQGLMRDVAVTDTTRPALACTVLAFLYTLPELQALLPANLHLLSVPVEAYAESETRPLSVELRDWLVKEKKMELPPPKMLLDVALREKNPTLLKLASIDKVLDGSRKDMMLRKLVASYTDEAMLFLLRQFPAAVQSPSEVLLLAKQGHWRSLAHCLRKGLNPPPRVLHEIAPELFTCVSDAHVKWEQTVRVLCVCASQIGLSRTDLSFLQPKQPQAEGGLDVDYHFGRIFTAFNFGPPK